MAAPELFDKKPSSFGVEIWYLGMFLYILFHPRKYQPFVNSPFSLRKNLKIPCIFNAYRYPDIILKRTPFDPLTGDRAKFNHLFERMLDYNQETRADINEVLEMLEEIQKSGRANIHLQISMKIRKINEASLFIF